MNTENTQTADLNNETKPKRKYKPRTLVEFPSNGETFTPVSLAARLEIPIYTVNNAIKKHRNKLEVVGNEPSSRGRKKPVYKMI